MPSPDSERGEQEKVQIVPDHLEKTSQVAVDLPQKLKQKLSICLALNKEVFA